MNKWQKWFRKNRVMGVQADSRKVKQGDVFVAYKGVGVDGHDYVDNAIKNGAVAVVGEKSLRLSVPYVKVADGRLAWAQMMAVFYGNPEKKIKFIGVTGTDGKTTTVNILAAALRVSGIKTGTCSTVGAMVGGKKVMDAKRLQTGLPSPDVLFPLLSEMKKQGIKMVVLETTSHGLMQERFGDITFKVGVITNLASDHMEYHGNFKKYRQAKARLIEKSEKMVLNELGGEYKYFKRRAGKKAVSFNRKNETRDISYIFGKDGIRHKAEVLYKGKWVKIETRLLGEYNLENILAVSKVAELLKIKQEDFVKAVNEFGGVEGRLVIVSNKRGINAVVDFAHTEQGLTGLLDLVNKRLKKKDEKMIVVFGCNGDRDRTKRAPMGKVAAELSDLVIVTNEDPRNEDPGQIFRDIEKGLKGGGMRLNKSYFREDDREKAIKKAVEMAKKGDWVLCLGKGHEKSIKIGNRSYDWNEKTTLKRALL